MTDSTLHTTLENQLEQIIRACPWRMDCLRHVEALGLPDGWIGAGFVRAAVWDHLHGLSASTPLHDIDVVWFEAHHPTKEHDKAIEEELMVKAPGHVWSVKNQARMHLRHGDEPYQDVADAMTHWETTATATAVRLVEDRIEVLAPFGLEDLFALKITPTPVGYERKLDLIRHRIRAKRWLEIWPYLVVDPVLL